MFVYEKVDGQDKALYEKVADRNYDAQWSQWAVDREYAMYIVCLGKHGVETPVIFRMLYQSHVFVFLLPEPDINTTPPKLWVQLPDALRHEQAAIQEAIRRAFREAKGLSAYRSLPANVDDHHFVFEQEHS
ncbi:MAG: hypothetical protein IKN55_04790 [Oscillospiraceae bacterium]|nr:hypothetical protein [Oscillospiraceae bacterium]